MPHVNKHLPEAGRLQGQHPGFAASQHVRKWIEYVLDKTKAGPGCAKTLVRGTEWIAACCMPRAAAADNLVRQWRAERARLKGPRLPRPPAPAALSQQTGARPLLRSCRSASTSATDLTNEIHLVGLRRRYRAKVPPNPSTTTPQCRDQTPQPDGVIEALRRRTNLASELPAQQSFFPANYTHIPCPARCPTLQFVIAKGGWSFSGSRHLFFCSIFPDDFPASRELGRETTSQSVPGPPHTLPKPPLSQVERRRATFQ